MRLLSHFDPADNGLLRRKARKVKNPQDTQVVIAVQAMKAAALDWEQRNPGRLCAGLAAPQIGVPLRIIMIRKRAGLAVQDPSRVPNPQEYYADENGEFDAAGFDAAQTAYRRWMRGPGASFDPFLVMYNPCFGESEGMQDSEEGCLSVPGVTGDTLRPERITFWYYDQNLRRVPKIGSDPDKPNMFEAAGVAACVITHEFDHLNGVLYTDSAIKTWETGSKPTDEEPTEAA